MVEKKDKEVSIVVGDVKLVSSVSIGDMGSIVFPAARCMVDLLVKEEENDPGWLKDKRVIELGCGTGVVGLVAAKLGGRVLMTDLGIYVGPIRENIEANKDIISGEASADALDWSCEVQDNLKNSADVLIISDCIYYEMSLEPLVKVIKSLIHEKSRIILGYEKRQEKLHLYEEFFQLMDEGFQTELRSEVILENGNSVYLINISCKR